MSNYATRSLIDIAEEILAQKKTQTNMYELFDIACEKKDIKETEKVNLIAQFYTDMISSAKFVYLGENEWDLKEHQEVTLWEKDGSYYKEYNKVDVPELEEEKPKPVVVKPKPKPVVEVVPEPVIEVEPEVVADAVIDEYNKEVMKEETVAVEEEIVAVATPETDFEDVFEEFEEEDDFDEEKYNEYMDTYEDQYDK